MPLGHLFCRSLGLLPAPPFFPFFRNVRELNQAALCFGILFLSVTALRVISSPKMLCSPFSFILESSAFLNQRMKLESHPPFLPHFFSNCLSWGPVSYVFSRTIPLSDTMLHVLLFRTPSPFQFLSLFRLPGSSPNALVPHPLPCLPPLFSS